MNKRTFLTLVPTLGLSLLGTGAASARDEIGAPPEAQKILVRMIEAVKAESYDAFLADADATLKTHLSRQQFEGVCGLYAQQLKKGYSLDYFGHLKQRGYLVHIWKVTATGAQDDALIKLALKDGKAGGVWIL
jgi:hypothetical protein